MSFVNTSIDDMTFGNTSFEDVITFVSTSFKDIVTLMLFVYTCFDDDTAFLAQFLMMT